MTRRPLELSTDSVLRAFGGGPTSIVHHRRHNIRARSRRARRQTAEQNLRRRVTTSRTLFIAYDRGPRNDDGNRGFIERRRGCMGYRRRCTLPRARVDVTRTRARDNNTKLKTITKRVNDVRRKQESVSVRTQCG